MNRVAIACYALALLITTTTLVRAADPQTDQTGQLQSLRAQIKEIQLNQGHNQEQQKQLNKQLQKIESQINDLGATVARLQQTRRTEQTQIGALEDSLAELQQRLGKHKKLLGHLARRAYLNGQQEYLKLLLNQQNPADIQRMLSYYRYLQGAHVAEITDVENTITLLLKTQQRLTSAEETAAETLEKIRQQQSLMATRRSEQQQLLTRLVADYQDNESRLRSMRKNEARLAQLVEQLQQALNDIPDSAGESFASARGVMKWPASGSIKHRFGERKHHSDVRWQGVLINTRSASEVRSVHAGRIAFADWLRGFGLLVIVDHGDDYMTVYGHNKTILRDSGSWIEQGEVIATAGANGGETESGLYFEIRHRGKPTDPAKWCRE